MILFLLGNYYHLRKEGMGRTLATGISLHELFFGACLLELWGEPCQLWQQFVHDPQLGSKIIFVNMECEVSADEACNKV